MLSVCHDSYIVVHDVYQYILENRSSCLTSAILVNEVGESPHVAQPDGVA